MTTESILTTLREELKKVEPKLPDGLGPDSHFKYEWNLDSLALVEFVARIEQSFGILIPDEDLPQFVSLTTTANYIQARLPT